MSAVEDDVAMAEIATADVDDVMRPVIDPGTVVRTDLARLGRSYPATLGKTLRRRAPEQYDDSATIREARPAASEDEDFDPVEKALELRRRLRALAMGQPEAFDMIFYHLGSNHPAATVAFGAGARIGRFVMLLADVAWTHGERQAHETSSVEVPAEVLEVRRVYRPHADTRRQYPMTVEQQVAVQLYLAALKPAIEGCIDLDAYAPSRTLAREAARFCDDISSLHDAVG